MLTRLSHLPDSSTISAMGGAGQEMMAADITDTALGHMALLHPQGISFPCAQALRDGPPGPER